ncbi:MAG: hypothetical protein J6O51_04675 [Bacteroidales bacterium]|nr:hypothetical protein [Bacteroidales bacterium]
MRELVILLSALTLTACSAAFQSQSGQSNSTAVAQSASETSRSISSSKGYTPTQDDVTRFNNDIEAFLKAKAPNYNKFGKVLIMIDDKKAESFNAVPLSKVKNISVLDSSNAAILGSTDYGSAIIIKTK